MIPSTSQQLGHLPNLVEIQLRSFEWFLERGLRELFRNFSPIEDFTGTLSLELVDYYLDKEKYSIEECRDRDRTYERPIKARVVLRTPSGDMQETEVYLGDLPMMTDRGTFVINGVDRVVVSQLARSPGVYFNDNIDFSGRILYTATLIPAEGAWLEIETDANDVMWVRVGQTRKFPLTTLLRALGGFEQARNYGYELLPKADVLGRIAAANVVDRKSGELLVEAGDPIEQAAFDKIQKVAAIHEVEVLANVPSYSTTGEILSLYGEEEELESPTRDVVYGRYPVEDLMDPKTGKVLVKAYQKISSQDLARRVEQLGLPTIRFVKPNRYIQATVEAEGNIHDTEDALADIYKTIRPGDPSTAESARGLLSSIFYDLRRYDLARVGRYKLNKKLGLTVPMDDRPELMAKLGIGHRAARSVTQVDLVAIIKYIIGFAEGNYNRDDIDHLENKRVRSVGELLQNQMRLGFLRMEKVARERMTAADAENVVPQVVLSVKPISASIKSFFGSSQLSQFMDQTNPLAELTHKRRLSALGPGGLSRQSAKLEVRDVHHSHYSRVCPIETPEGPNIGLIGSLAISGRVDEFGFLLAPYRKVVNGKVTDQIDYLTADEEDRFSLAPASTKVNENGEIDGATVCRRHGTFPTLQPKEVDYIDIMPMQIVSPATALIPFLENDDPSRALMGSNMQRQAVPTLRPQSPVCKTGVEGKVASDSGAAVVARRDGRIIYVTAERIVVETRDKDEDGKPYRDVYRLLNMLRSNNATCITQRPIVKKGERIRKGQVIADGPSMQNGELALGQNVLVAFVTWNGYNYEDAILVNERLVRDDVYTSIHIEKYETEARDTKLGPEEITRDIPNVSEDALKDLDEDGIIRVGAEVRAEDILVGKVAPKGQGELTPEERLVIAIFGKKAEETRDVSLRLPHGEKGKVIDIKRFSRFKYQCRGCQTVYDFSKKPDRTVCEKYECGGELERIQADELPAGVNMLVRVYIAQKRKLMEGDKMAGRHGNKGVISKIVPEEDMPFLPDGTPVDIVLNPLGVPARMNIGQIMETHMGLVSRFLGAPFANPIFQGRKESEIVAEMQKLGERLRSHKLWEYATEELKLELDGSAEDPLEDLTKAVRKAIKGLDKETLFQLGAQLGVEPVEGGDPLIVAEALEEDEEPDAESEPRTTQLWPVTADAVMQRAMANVNARVGFLENEGKMMLRDGRTGEYFESPVTIGLIYMLKLAHLVDDKIHARSTGPYSLVTQQPLGGKAQFGGQRFGEMEVWALEAYGAAYTLQEILTIKSDDVLGRVKTYEAIVKGDTIMAPGIPESFRILVNELQSLGLKVTVEDREGQAVDLRDQEEDYGEGAEGARRRQIRRIMDTGHMPLSPEEQSPVDQ
jgi:DNA-directed RNA polymerase subunit beta